MDDRFERQAALEAISSHKDEILDCCEEGIELLDALEALKLITQTEKDKANEDGDYGLVICRLTEKINEDPGFFNKFCHYITQKEELSDLATILGGESLKVIILCS